VDGVVWGDGEADEADGGADLGDVGDCEGVEGLGSGCKLGVCVEGDFMSGRGNKTNRIAGLVGRPFDMALFAHVGEFVIGEQAEMFIDWC
jgi:hypothetical protein